MQTYLTREIVEKAHSDKNHPVIEVLESYDQKLQDLEKEMNLLDSGKHYEFIRKNYGFLADAVEVLQEFSLSSENLISIWSFAGWKQNDYVGRTVARILALSYGTQGTGLKGLSRFYIENLDINVEDKNSKHIFKRLQDIRKNTNEIRIYLYGTDESLVRKMFLLSREGNKEKEIADLLAIERLGKEKTTPAIDGLLENFGTALAPIEMYLEKD